jgi:hypothetical protein
MGGWLKGKLYICSASDVYTERAECMLRARMKGDGVYG